MVKYFENQMDHVFFALADSTRRGILENLSKKAMKITELAKPFGLSLPAVSKHIKVLERAGLIKRQVQGRVHQCHFEAQNLNEAMDWIRFHTQLWNNSLDRLEQVLTGDQTKKEI